VDRFFNAVNVDKADDLLEKLLPERLSKAEAFLFKEVGRDPVTNGRADNNSSIIISTGMTEDERG
jgi:hypothetical protein